MNVDFETTVRTNSKKYFGSMSLGWYSGSEPVLVKVTLLEFTSGFITIFDLQILKFTFGLYFTEDV